MTFFSFAEYWWFYLAFTGFVLALLALDLGVFHRKAHAVSVKAAGAWTVVWVSLALLFNLGFYYYAKWKFPEAGGQLALEFFTGYLVEKSLAVDNIFVFAIVFSYFGVPKEYQHRILFYGIIGALVFRAGFIALGSYLMAYQWTALVFGVFLIFTGIKMAFSPEGSVDPDKNILIRALRRILPIYPKMDGSHFFHRENGKTYVTPLLLTLVVIEFSDIIFAVDSVPAIFAITKEPLIVFTSNIFAILGLRSMYFLMLGVLDRFAYIKYGLSAVLVFVGLKMVWLNEAFGGKFPVGWSLGIIAGLLGSSVLVSLILAPKHEAKEAPKALPPRAG